MIARTMDALAERWERAIAARDAHLKRCRRCRRADHRRRGHRAYCPIGAPLITGADALTAELEPLVRGELEALGVKVSDER